MVVTVAMSLAKPHREHFTRGDIHDGRRSIITHVTSNTVRVHLWTVGAAQKSCELYTESAPWFYVLIEPVEQTACCEVTVLSAKPPCHPLRLCTGSHPGVHGNRTRDCLPLGRNRRNRSTNSSHEEGGFYSRKR